MGRRADDGDNVKDVNNPDTPKNFDDVLKDCVVFTVLLNQLDPTSCNKSALNKDKPLDRVKKVINNAWKLGVETVPEDIDDGNVAVNELLLSEIYNTINN